MPDQPAASLAYRIARKVNDILGDPLHLPIAQQPEPKGTLEATVSIIRREFEEFFTLTQDRRKRYRDYDRMDVGSVATMLNDIVDACTIADDGSLYGFRIEAGAKVRNLLDGVKQRNSLDELSREVLRNTLKYGDEFVGLTLNDQGDVTYLSQLPVGEMLVRVDTHARLLPGAEMIMINGQRTDIPSAYWQVDPATGHPLAGWYPWEMCHLKLYPTRLSAYSRTSLLEEIRGDWHKLRMVEEGMVIARLLRAYLRHIHKLDVTGKDAKEAADFIKAYMDLVKRAKLAADPTTGERSVEMRSLGVEEDLYLGTGYITAPDGSAQPMLSDITVIDPQNSGLRSIPDVEHLQRKIFSRVSAEIVGIPGDREDVSQQDVASSRFYQYLQAFVLERRFLRPIFDLSLRLKGYTPSAEAYKIVWPKVIIESSWRYADAGFRRSMMDANYIEAGIVSRRRIALARFGLSDAEWEAEQAHIQQEMTTFGAISRSSDAQQVRLGHQAS